MGLDLCRCATRTIYPMRFVLIGVLVKALRRFGPERERERLHDFEEDYDLFPLPVMCYYRYKIMADEIGGTPSTDTGIIIYKSPKQLLGPDYA